MDCSRHRRFFSLAYVAMVCSTTLLGAMEPIRFNRDIRPILSDQCFACHGFDSKKRAADLRLDTPEGAFEKLASGQPIVPGDPAASLVWQRINAADPEERMPPESSHKQLTGAQKEILRRWIEEGAEYEKHWAFETPIKPQVPSTASNPIDAFIRARLSVSNLQPSPLADRATLLRRLSFALTGLPPSPDAAAEFLRADHPVSYEAMVDRYLQSPQFGEEQAKYWLDVARYADTHGLHLDNEREMWAYRDWVIRAFNENLPFNQFTQWQIAGDLLPEPTQDQLIATGFNRCNVTTSEGGAIDEEFRYRYAVDRASTVMETWLGLTGGCAVCHDHKYDPLTTREFYSFYAFFNNAADPPMDKNIATTEPFIKLYTAEQQSASKRLQDLEAEASKDLLATAKQIRESQSQTSSAADGALVSDILLDDHFPIGTATKNTTRNPTVWVGSDRYPIKFGTRALFQSSSSFISEDITLNTAPILFPQDAVIEVWVYLDPASPPNVISMNFKLSPQRRVYWGPEQIETYDIPGAANAYRVGPLPRPGVWTRLTIPTKGLEWKPDQLIKDWSLEQSGGNVLWDRLCIHGSTNHSKDPRSDFLVWWKGAGGKPMPEVPGALQDALKAGPEKGAEHAQRNELHEFFLAHIARPTSPEIIAKRRAWETARVAREMLEQSVPGTFIYRDQPKSRESFVMLRGQYDKPGERVQPTVPAILPPLKVAEKLASADAEVANVPPTRLDLAKWLTSNEQPLTARVTVNRFWQQIFGTGIVETSHDFGSQGTPPTHPELLDYLAVQFQESGWNVKALLKLMVMSETFQQSSVVRDELKQQDLGNRLLARGPRFRLDAEQIRDNVLFVSGLLNPAMGGRGVRPYQPGNIWEPVGYQNSNTRFYLQDHGADLYRRSVYVFLKRTAPPPFMSNFDAPNREQFCTRRERSNTPLQALQLMNDVQHIEAARVLAERMLQEVHVNDSSRIAAMFQRVLTRNPDEVELKLLQEALEDQRRHYSAQLEEAEALVKQGEAEVFGTAPVQETAAWTVLANLVFNLDETVTRN